MTQSQRRNTTDLGLLIQSMANEMQAAGVMDCKPYALSEVKKKISLRSIKDFLDQLKVYTSMDLWGVSFDAVHGLPFQSEETGGLVTAFTKTDVPQMFVFTSAAGRYLVDTQGFDYARYMVKLI